MAIKRFPEADILVNNLGIFEIKPFEDIPDADWLRFFEVNILSGMRLSRHYLSHLFAAHCRRLATERRCVRMEAWCGQLSNRFRTNSH